MTVRWTVSDRPPDRPPDRPFFLGSPSPGARPRGLGDHPPALPSPLRGRSLRRARAFSPPTLPSHRRGGAGVRGLLYAFPPSPPLRAGISQDLASRRGHKQKKTAALVGSFRGGPDRCASAYCQELFYRWLFGVFFSATVPRLPWSLPRTPCCSFGLSAGSRAAKSAEPRAPS